MEEEKKERRWSRFLPKALAGEPLRLKHARLEAGPQQPWARSAKSLDMQNLAHLLLHSITAHCSIRCCFSATTGFISGDGIITSILAPEDTNNHVQPLLQTVPSSLVSDKVHPRPEEEPDNVIGGLGDGTW